MQTLSSEEFAEVSGKFENDFITKLKIDDENVENEEKHDEEDLEEEEDLEDEEEEEEEFSFFSADPNSSPISADDVFDNGQIRTVYPIFDQSLLFSGGDSGPRSPVRKIFVQQRDDSSSSSSEAAETSTPVEGPCCEWTPKTAVKSNSTGSSKLWKFRDAKLRCNSDGKDAFVFLNPPIVRSEKASSDEVKNVGVKKVKAVKGKTTSSAHEKHYVMTKARKESDKRKSYLPYRQELFGFFSSTNGLSRNVHPY